MAQATIRCRHTVTPISMAVDLVTVARVQDQIDQRDQIDQMKEKA